MIRWRFKTPCSLATGLTRTSRGQDSSCNFIVYQRKLVLSSSCLSRREPPHVPSLAEAFHRPAPSLTQSTVERANQREFSDAPAGAGTMKHVEAAALYAGDRTSWRMIVTVAEALPSSGPEVAQAAAGFQWDGHGFEAGIGIAASGGGFRAMLFHAGAFLRLSELGILTQAKRISSVSGGSIACGYLASLWNTLAQNGFANFKLVFVEPILALLPTQDRCGGRLDRCLALDFRRRRGSR
jgi:hypothetical protein